MLALIRGATLFLLVRSARAAQHDLTLLYGPPRTAPATGPLRVLPPPLDATQTLREAAAAAGIHIGAAINYGGMHDIAYGPNYAATALREFDLFTAENECKVGPVHPEVNEYAFDECDYIISTAVRNGSLPRMCVKQGDAPSPRARGNAAQRDRVRAAHHRLVSLPRHNYCWHTENPAWLNNMHDPALLRAALSSHIGNMTSHYLGAPGGALAYYAVDVVNEAVSDGGVNAPLFKQAAPWYPAVPTYVEDAFRAAAAVNAGRALLCYNGEEGCCDGGRRGFEGTVLASPSRGSLTP